jgi:four helix bundle protein
LWWGRKTESRMQKADEKRHHFRELKCWQKGRELRKSLYQIAKSLPDFEKYALVSQIRRAAVSITANMAEGYGRFHYKENIQFCRQSRASVYECEDHLITCLDEKYIDQKKYNENLEIIVETRKILDGYIRYLEDQSKAKKEDRKQ